MQRPIFSSINQLFKNHIDPYEELSCHWSWITACSCDYNAPECNRDEEEFKRKLKFYSSRLYKHDGKRNYKLGCRRPRTAPPKVWNTTPFIPVFFFTRGWRVVGAHGVSLVSKEFLPSAFLIDVVIAEAHLLASTGWRVHQFSASFWINLKIIPNTAGGALSSEWNRWSLQCSSHGAIFLLSLWFLLCFVGTPSFLSPLFLLTNITKWWIP